MEYILMNKNTPVLMLEMDEGNIVSVKDIYNALYLPVGVSVNSVKASLREWWAWRRIPFTRAELREGLRNLGVRSAALLTEKCLGLSLTDQYWLNPCGQPLKWENVNFFGNAFSEDVGKALFDGVKQSEPDLLAPDGTTDGWLKKRWRIINGSRCLVKAGSEPYFQQPFNEVITSIVCRRLGISSYVEYSLEFDNNEPVSVCESFLTEDKEYVPANLLLAGRKKPNNVSDYEFYAGICAECGVKDIKSHLAEMLVVDYIIRNEDRHYGNFGLIRDSSTLEYLSAAPIFDSGTSLLWDTAGAEIPRKCCDRKSPSKPFRVTHDRQISLVSEPERFDLNRLYGIDEEVYELLLTGGIIDEKRAGLLSRALKRRIEKLDSLFAKGRE